MKGRAFGKFSYGDVIHHLARAHPESNGDGRKTQNQSLEPRSASKQLIILSSSSSSDPAEGQVSLGTLHAVEAHNWRAELTVAVL